MAENAAVLKKRNYKYGEMAEWFEPEAHQPLAENAAVLKKKKL